MEKIHKFFSPDWFKLICLIVSIAGCVPFLTGTITPYLKLFHLYAFAVLAVDLFTEKRILRNKGRFILFVFSMVYAVTLLNNRNLITFSGLSDFSYLLISLAIFYSYGIDSERNDRITGRIICFVLSLMNLIGIWMFYSKFFKYIASTGSFIGMYVHENRLCGLWGNPAVQGMMAFIGLSLSGVLCFQSTRKYKPLYVGLAVINFVCMLLANARTAIFCFVFICAVYVFLITLKDRRNVKGVTVSILAGLVMVILVYSGCRLAQRTALLFDVHYDYYLMNIDRDYAIAHADESAAAEATEASTAPSDDPLPMPNADRNSSGLNGRGELWSAGLKLAARKPLFGHGMNNLNYALEQYGYGKSHISGNLHNVYLDCLVAFGLVGFACLVLFLLMILGNVKKFFRYSDGSHWKQVASLCSIVAGFLLYGMADSSLMFSMYPMAFVFWFIFAQMVNLIEKENKHTGHYRPDIMHLLEKKLSRKRIADRKSICFVNDSLGGGGAEQILLNVSNALEENGYDVTILTLWSDGLLESKLNKNIKLETADPFDLFFMKRVLHWVNRHCMPKRLYNFLFLDGRYDYTVAFMEGLSTRVVADTKIRRDKKKYAWVHIDFKEQNWTLPYYRSAQAQVASYESFDRIFCVSEAVRDAFVEVIGFAPKVVVQHNLVDTRGVLEKAQEKCPEQRPNGLLLCSVGRLNLQKGYDRLLRVFARIISEGLDCTLWILGEGDLRADLEKQIIDLGLAEHVRLLGFQSNPFCYAAQADVFVCSSRAEGYSTVITENLLLGNPIVSTLCAGVQEQLGNDEYGIVTQNNEDALYEGVFRMLSNKELREHYAQKARERSKIMAYEVIVEQFLNIFS